MDITVVTVGNLQRYHRGYGSDHSVLENSQLTPEQQHPNRQMKKNIHPFTCTHLFVICYDTDGMCLSYSPMGHAGQQQSGGRCGCCCWTSNISTRLGYWLLRKFNRNTRKL